MLQTTTFIAMDPPVHDAQRKAVAGSVAPTNLHNMEALDKGYCIHPKLENEQHLVVTCKNCKEEILKGDETKGTGNNIVHKKCKAIVSIKKAVEFKYTSYPSGLPRTYKEE
mgnify:CR=1 FL=1